MPPNDEWFRWLTNRSHRLTTDTVTQIINSLFAVPWSLLNDELNAVEGVPLTANDRRLSLAPSFVENNVLAPTMPATRRHKCFAFSIARDPGRQPLAQLMLQKGRHCDLGVVRDFSSSSVLQPQSFPFLADVGLQYRPLRSHILYHASRYCKVDFW